MYRYTEDFLWYLRGMMQCLFIAKKYNIKRGYHHRKQVINFDDTKNTDEWQDEVYLKAKEISNTHGFQSIIDFGCGSGYKLIKYFNDFTTIGFELEPTLTFLQQKYNHKQWKSFDEDARYNCDVLILSDVIEHLENPTETLQKLLNTINFNYIFISTPDRNLLKDRRKFGPPRNVSHFREWTFQEFRDYLEDFFIIEDHMISNEAQATQLIIGKKRK